MQLGRVLDLRHVQVRLQTMLHQLEVYSRKPSQAGPRYHAKATAASGPSFLKPTGLVVET